MPDAYGNPTAEEVAAAQEAVTALIGQPQSITAGDRTVTEPDVLKHQQAVRNLAHQLTTAQAAASGRSGWNMTRPARVVTPGAE